MIEYRSIGWWYWLVTVGFLTAGMSGWQTGFLLAIGLTVFQLIHFTIRERSITAFPVQVRLGYLLLLLVALPESLPVDLLDSNDWNLGAGYVWLLRDGPNGLAPAMELRGTILFGSFETDILFGSSQGKHHAGIPSTYSLHITCRYTGFS